MTEIIKYLLRIQAEGDVDIRGPVYEEREHIPLHEAITWAHSFDAPVTLYVYYEDGGIY